MRALLVGLIVLAIVILIAVAGSWGWWNRRFRPDRIEEFARRAAQPLRVHIFEPEQRGRNRPAILFFFGGGWTLGYPQQFFPFAQELARSGYVAMAADYRVNSRDGSDVFDALADARSAYRWLRQNAAEFGIDQNRIVLSGGSAGGHLAAATAVIADTNAEPLLPPAALVLFNPVLDTSFEEETKLKNLAKLFRGRGLEVSPLHHIAAGNPPTLIMHGDADGMVPIASSRQFCERMEKSGNDCVLVEFPDQGHGFFNYGFRRENFHASLEAMRQFLDAKVKH